MSFGIFNKCKPFQKSFSPVKVQLKYEINSKPFIKQIDKIKIMNGKGSDDN